RFNPNSSLYNIPTVWHLKGNWIPEALEKGFNRLIERHESLRTVFKEIGEQPVQQIVEFLPRALPVRDYSQLPLEVKEKEVDSLIAREAQEPFDLMNGPLIRNQLVQLEKDEWLLLCTMHHIISDAWSIGIFMNELLAFYEEEMGGNPAKLSSLSIQYADYKPYEYVDASKSDEIIGFDVDVAKYIGKELGYEVKVKDMDFGGLLASLSSGKVDFVMAGMTPTAERKNNVDFTDIYFVAKNMVVSKKDSNIQSVEGLKGKKVGVQTGSIQEEKAAEFKKQVDFQVEGRDRIPEIVQEIKFCCFITVFRKGNCCSNFFWCFFN
ncbi:condensation domain-containing protein, partial [Bacillus sp. HC-Mk]